MTPQEQEMLHLTRRVIALEGETKKIGELEKAQEDLAKVFLASSKRITDLEDEIATLSMEASYTPTTFPEPPPKPVEILDNHANKKNYVSSFWEKLIGR